MKTKTLFFQLILIFLFTQTLLAGRSFTEYKVPVNNYNLYVKEYKGTEPALILLHGFPDNHVLYDSLLPYLSTRHVITFDFMGWGLSDKPSPANYPYGDIQQSAEIDAVVNYLKLESVVVACHDMSGPAGINWSLDHKSKAAGLILMNTYFHESKNRHVPLTGVALSTAGLRQFTIPFCIPNFLWNPVLKLSTKNFFTKKENRKAFTKPFIAQFKSLKDKRPFFRTLASIKQTAKRDSKRLAEVKQFTLPVSIMFGAGEKNFTTELAEEFHGLFPNSTLHLIKEATHYPQIDAPKQLGQLMNEFLLKKEIASIK